MMKKHIDSLLALICLATLLLTSAGCKKKRISYTDMIKRETKDVRAFMDKEGFRVIEKLPQDLKMDPKEFVEVAEGVWLNVIEPGTLDEMAVSGVTPVLVRFSYTSTSSRLGGYFASFSNIGSTESDIPPVSFIYQANINSDYQQGPISAAPHSTDGEEKMSPFACNAMMIALRYVPLGSTVKMFVSFREGPSFTIQSSAGFANENETGVALYYDKMTFRRKP